MKLPSFQFYPGGWMKDPGLRSVSLEARGLWIDMLCLLFESGRRGYLQHATGKPVSDEQLARMTGSSSEQVSRLLQELDDSGVFSRTEHGTIYSRRMIRDERKRKACSEAGKMGGGNPDFNGIKDLRPTFKGQPKGDSKGGRKGESKQNPNLSSSFSTSYKRYGPGS
jgi:biotin operon repressor